MVGETETQTPTMTPYIVYRPSTGEYVELCGSTEEAAALEAFRGSPWPLTVSPLVAEDIRHTHNGDGTCIPVIAPKGTRAAADMRTRMGRAFTAGLDYVFL